MVTADRVTARVSSSHPKTGEQPRIVPIGSSFENLRIAGYQPEIVLAVDTFSEYGTRESLEKTLANPDLKGQLDSHVIGKTEAGITCTFLRSIKGLGKEIIVNGNEIRIPDFGAIRLAMIEIADRRRRVSMLQFELGSTPAGTGSAGGAEGNGSDN